MEHHQKRGHVGHLLGARLDAGELSSLDVALEREQERAQVATGSQPVGKDERRHVSVWFQCRCVECSGLRGCPRQKVEDRAGRGWDGDNFLGCAVAERADQVGEG